MRSNGRLGILLTQGALALVLIASAIDVVRAHGELSTALVRQKPNDELIGRIDAQLDALARGTQALATQGNANAQKIVAALAQSGVRINAKQGAR